MNDWPRPRPHPTAGAPKINDSDRPTDTELELAREQLRQRRYGTPAKRAERA